METKHLFSINRKSSRLNESLGKKFGNKINLESFDLQQLEDTRNKLRTQMSQIRQNSGFNETLENDSFLKAQFMLDAINAEIAERELIVDTVEEGAMKDVDYDLQMLAREEDEDQLIGALQGEWGSGVADALNDMMSELQDELASKGMNDVMNDDDKMIEMLMDMLVEKYSEGDFDDEGGETDDNYALSSAGFGSDEDYGDFGRDESIQYEGSEFNDKDEKLYDWLMYHGNEMANSWDTEIKGYALLEFANKLEKGKMSFEEIREEVFDMFDQGEWQRADFIKNFAPNKIKKLQKAESADQGDSMRRVTEGEIQQASAIVTAKTMVDRVGRWIEELSGMENETLLQLGDSIRDEMGMQQSRSFIEQVAPAIQTALETLKTTRESLSNSVNALATGAQEVEMLGAEPSGEEDMMEPTAGAEAGAEEPAGDEFAAAEPAAGGAEAAGREQRESVDFQNRLLKVLAG